MFLVITIAEYVMFLVITTKIYGYFRIRLLLNPVIKLKYKSLGMGH